MIRKVILGWILLIGMGNVWAQSDTTQTKVYTTAQLQSEIVIDGLLDDPAWSQVDWGGDFIGHRPEYNVAPSQKTQFKILYDAKYLYVGVRSFDTEPDKIARRMSRRDGFEGDFVEINIDSYHDKRTAFSFSASVSGVKGDEYVSNNGSNWDSTWDPIWYLKTSIDEEGWIAEFKIPLSQLRFADKEEHVWGLQLTRRLFRKEERSTWQPVDPNAPGWVHLFGELRGIKGIKPQKQLEIMPYVVGSAETFKKEEENPFREDGYELNANVGVDAKIGITSDITLDLTVNPDFGQVESDPSAVNLSAFRLFFREQRPFFLEGSNIMSFRTSGGINNLYYSRRIGGKPQGNADADDVAYIDAPNQSRILGAAKITGKNAKGFSWGILESFTNREYAQVIDTLGDRRKEKIAPYSNYLVARAQQDYGDGKTVVGAYFSNVNRFNNNENGLELLHDDAQSGGVDINHNFANRNYGFEFKAMVSRVNGSEEAIYETQTSAERYYQRPDNDHRSVDSTLTTLYGSAGTLAFGKRSGNWRWTIGSNYKSPGLELNDVGFLVQTDIINNWAWTQYRINKPTKLFRSQRYRAYIESNLDFGGVTTNKGGEINMNWDFHNLWSAGTGLWRQGSRISNADLRGGPSITYPGGFNYWYWFETNSRKKISFSYNNSYYWGDEDFSKNVNFRFSVNYQPTDALRVSLSPRVSHRRNALQYIDQIEDAEQMHYLMGEVQQQTYSMSLRANYNITPNLTIELWAQPFMASGQYQKFKFDSDTNAGEFEDRFLDLNTQYVYDEDQSYYTIDGYNGLQFDDPDFNIVEFRSNLVTRWEYIPGSTLFLVWSNNGGQFDRSEKNEFSDLSANLKGLESTNTFLIKYTYRFIL
ncbi:DUF5916 domain-containing protein [Reichenbachiella ulvae]|uniref:DUF5916 domain-containing protein n=1 Tax=Reichenbachiella ulvae TaxID=2980104 RepID=A0ABT3CX40_9BACT|nr:DUF5916 domain-containing protein [Reichenbachiella ulvae]MCV9388141.1 DUF5916 domain-containing protein [Reichenbachiella ulvae]